MTATTAIPRDPPGPTDPDRTESIVCPGVHLHTRESKPGDCTITWRSGIPTVRCWHIKCRLEVERYEADLQSLHMPVPLLFYSVLAKSAPSPAAEVIAGVLHEGCRMILSGPPKARKTWAALQLAIVASSGGCWLAHEVRKCPVIVVDYELPQWAIVQRINTIATALSVTVGDLRVACLRGSRASGAAVRAACAGKAGLVIIDPLYRMLGGGCDENSNTAVGAAMRELDDLTQTGAAVVCVHHHRKGGGKGPEAMSGASAFLRDPDSVINMEPDSAGDGVELCYTLRHHAPLARRKVYWENGLFR